MDRALKPSGRVWITAVLATLLPAVLPWALQAQAPADLGVREKTEVFIQHMIKVAKVDPARYQALVLEYEIGVALEELQREAKEEEGGEGGKAPTPLVRDFVERALKEIHPEYASLAGLIESGKVDEARDLARKLSGSVDPYLAAHAGLALAEIQYRGATGGPTSAPDPAGLEALIQSCERIVEKDRLYLIGDHRACELIALAFEKLKKPLLEFVQYAILLTDYNELPADVEKRAKERIAALNEEVGRPLGTVANWMESVEQYLRREITRPDPTQRQEGEILTALDKLIELQEARERRT